MSTPHGQRARLGARLFDAVWRHNLVYNQCWEDPAVDRQALDLQPSDRVLVITSAGCNALDYALTGAEVLAVDANPLQNHLLELKRAGIRALSFDAFFALFGEGGSPDCVDIYRALRPELPDAAREFWDRQIRLFHPNPALGRSFYFRGTAGLFALAMKVWIDHGARVRHALDRILDAEGLEQQLRLYHAEVRGPLLGDLFLRLVGSPSILSLLGVPDPQRRMVHAHPGGFAGFLRSCLDRVMALCPLRDNYFWRVYVTGRYSSESCPEYLKRDNFQRLKAGLVDRVQTFDGTVTECLAAARRPFTAFVLLDHMDWLARHPSALLQEWTRIFAAATPTARIIFRSGGPDASFLPREVRTHLSFDAALAKRLHLQDRVGTYGSFHIARLAFA
jgi:S-adenosylmethionine-diacylglycerol 3-amino-3-carboxypropyl transferase